MIRSIASLALFLWACGRDKSDDDTGEAPTLTGPLANQSSFEIITYNSNGAKPNDVEARANSFAITIFGEYEWAPNFVLVQEVLTTSQGAAMEEALRDYFPWFYVDDEKGEAFSPSGLAIWADGESNSTAIERFDICSNEDEFDCLANKGIMYNLFDFNEEGGSLAVLNLHMDAGDTDEDIAARVSQLEELATLIEKLKSEGVKYFVIGGDWNFEEADANNVYFEDFIAENPTMTSLGFYNACDADGVDCTTSVATLVEEVNEDVNEEEEGCAQEQNYDDSANLLDHFLFSSENLKVDGLDFGAAYYENSSGLICVTSDHPIMRLQVSVKS